MIDLHAHTAESDGTLPPEDLVRAAVEIRLEALGITDHDTFAGHDAARPLARDAGLDLVCGVEISSKFRRKSVHVLGYFLSGDPPASFRGWLDRMQAFRRDRNRRLAARLQSLGLPVTLEEAEARGRSLTGRPHFAQVLVEKGIVDTPQQAFQRYIGERGAAYVEREEPSLESAVSTIAGAGGLAALAHPVRVDDIEELMESFEPRGLRAIEVWHSDHTPRDVERFAALARRFGLAVTGGSDFHGGTKPGVQLGTGRGNLAIPRAVLDELRRSFIP